MVCSSSGSKDYWSRNFPICGTVSNQSLLIIKMGLDEPAATFYKRDKLERVANSIQKQPSDKKRRPGLRGSKGGLGRHREAKAIYWLAGLQLARRSYFESRVTWLSRYGLSFLETISRPSHDKTDRQTLNYLIGIFGKNSASFTFDIPGVPRQLLVLEWLVHIQTDLRCSTCFAEYIAPTLRDSAAAIWSSPL